LGNVTGDIFISLLRLQRPKTSIVRLSDAPVKIVAKQAVRSIKEARLMAYLVVYSRGFVVARQALAGGMTTIGRSPDCTVVVRDILLSRSHCRIDAVGDAWVLSDLHSKNGTIIEGSKIDKHTLAEGDKIRMGKTMIVFHADEMPAALAKADHRMRPTDPVESLAGTVWGMTLDADLPEELPDRFALPRPAPPLPAAYERENIHKMLEEIASSSWDSIYAESRKPQRAGVTTETIDRPRQRPMRPEGVCLSLQINGDVLESFRRKQRKTRRTARMQKVIRTAYKISPWIALIGILKAA
jgi:predicted component of type VI protein secretion system